MRLEEFLARQVAALEEELECPVCLEVLTTSPLYKCVDDHLICPASTQHRHLFPVRPNTMNTRSGQQFKEYQCRTAKYYTSAVPAMARALNARGISPTGSTMGTTITTTSGNLITI